MTQSGSSQWQNLLCNLGAWEGSFTKLSPQGKIQADQPTLITFEGFDDNTRILQTIDRFSPDRSEVTEHRVLEYQPALSRSLLLFEGGAFSQGSMQFAPNTQFGAELGFIWGKYRLRLVQLFDEAKLSSLTLIREHIQGQPPLDRPPLTVEQLIGQWQGEAVTMYPDWRSTQYTTTLVVEQAGTRLNQRLTSPQMEMASSAQINDSTLLFEDGKFPVQVLLLPGGASANTPLTIPRGQPFFLEAGWLIEPNLRQRMIRSYDAQGGWSSLTLVTERRSG
jgi:Domain of unknown function (DUF3598)